MLANPAIENASANGILSPHHLLLLWKKVQRQMPQPVGVEHQIRALSLVQHLHDDWQKHRWDAAEGNRECVLMMEQESLPLVLAW